jgi:hypothetical protein
LYVVNKADLIEGDSEDEQVQLWKAEWEAFKAKHPESHLISATNQVGLQETLGSLHNLVFSSIERSNPEAA